MTTQTDRDRERGDGNEGGNMVMVIQGGIHEGGMTGRREATKGGEPETWRNMTAGTEGEQLKRQQRAEWKRVHGSTPAGDPRNECRRDRELPADSRLTSESCDEDKEV